MASLICICTHKRNSADLIGRATTVQQHMYDKYIQFLSLELEPLLHFRPRQVSGGRSFISVFHSLGSLLVLCIVAILCIGLHFNYKLHELFHFFKSSTWQTKTPHQRQPLITMLRPACSKPSRCNRLVPNQSSPIAILGPQNAREVVRAILKHLCHPGLHSQRSSSCSPRCCG